MLFDDTFRHSVTNERTSGRRVVLFIDVPRADCGPALNAVLPLFVRALRWTPRASRMIKNSHAMTGGAAAEAWREWRASRRERRAAAARGQASRAEASQDEL